MAPKNGPPAAKQALILQWFHKSLTAHSLKELEKALPTACSISGMQVKDYLQALLDDSQIRVEKIGSGNWYWSFVSDAKKDKQRMMSGLKEEETKLLATLDSTDRDLALEEDKRMDGEEMLVDGDGADGMDRKQLLKAKEVMMAEKIKLETALMGYKENDPTEVLRKQKQTQKLRESAERWTDNIDGLMTYLKKSAGMDKSQIAAAMEQLCGDEWVPGEGLKDL